MGNCVTAKACKQPHKKELEVTKHPSLVVLPSPKQAQKPEQQSCDNGTGNFQTPQSGKNGSAQASTAMSVGFTGASAESKSEKGSAVSPFRPRGESNASELTADMNPTPKPKKISYLLNVNGIEYKVPLLDPIETSSLLSRRFADKTDILPLKLLSQIEVARRPRGGSYNLDVVGKTNLSRKF